MTGSSGDPRGEHKPVSQRLWLIGIVADVAAVLAVLAGSTRNIALVVGAVALLLGAMQLVMSLGKPVDRWVILAVVGIVAGTVTITAVVSRSLVDTVAQVGGSTSGVTTSTTSVTSDPSTSGVTTSTTSVTSDPSTSEQRPTTTTRATSAVPGVSRMSGDKPILLTDDYALDLDSQEPYWVANRIEDASGYDLEYDSSYLWAPEDIAPATPQATLDECVRAGYISYIEGSELVTGAAFCVKTTSGAFARIVITAKEGSSGQLTLDIVVWQKRT